MKLLEAAIIGFIFQQGKEVSYDVLYNWWIGNSRRDGNVLAEVLNTLLRTGELDMKVHREHKPRQATFSLREKK